MCKFFSPSKLSIFILKLEPSRSLILRSESVPLGEKNLHVHLVGGLGIVIIWRNIFFNFYSQYSQHMVCSSGSSVRIIIIIPFGLFFPYIGNNNPNWRTPSFFRGVGLNHQPVIHVLLLKAPFFFGGGSIMFISWVCLDGFAGPWHEWRIATKSGLAVTSEH